MDKITLESDVLGKITGLDVSMLQEYPFFLLTQPPNNSVSVSASQSSQANIMAVSGDGPIIVVAMGIKSTGTCLISLSIQDGGSQRALMNGNCESSIIFGSAGKPYYLPAPLFVPENKNVVARITDTSGSTNNVRISMWGLRITRKTLDLYQKIAKSREGERQYLTTPYFYTMKPTNNSSAKIGALRLSALGSSTQAIDIGGGNHFQMLTLSRTSTGAFTLQINEAATGETLINAPQGQTYAIRDELLCGNGQFPYRMPWPRTFKAGSKLILTLTDLSNANNDIYLVIGGRNIATRLNNRGKD